MSQKLSKMPLKVVIPFLLITTTCVLGLGKLFLYDLNRVLIPPGFVAATSDNALTPCSAPQRETYAFCENPRVEFGLNFQEVKFSETLGDRQIYSAGWWTRRGENTGEQTLILLAHGAGQDRRAMMKHFSYLHQRYDLLALDLHAHGLAWDQAEKPGARKLSYGLRESESIIVAKNWAKKQGYKHIVIFGADLGGFAALRAAALAPQDFQAVITEGAFSSASEGVELLGRPLLSSLFFPCFSLLNGFPIENIDIKFFGSRIKANVLVIHAVNDPVIPPSEAHKILAALQSKTEVWLVPQNTHNEIWNHLKEEYQERVLNFLQGLLSEQI